jgi:hypothetical protein
MPHCSFCGSPSHTIRTCNSEDVHAIYIRIIDIYNDYKYYISGKHLLTLALASFRPSELKAVCIRYLDYNFNNGFQNKHKCVGALVDYLYRLMPYRLSAPPAHAIEICKVIMKNPSKNSTTHECAICYECTKPSDFIKLNCSHTFCKSCIKSIFTTHSPRQFTPEYAPKCALCRSQITLLTAAIPAYNSLVRSTYTCVKLVE